MKPPARFQREPVPSARMKATKTILHVEDDAVVSTAYKRRLEGEGYAVHSVPDGVEALKYLQHSQPDIILLDLLLPRLNGEDVLKIVFGNSRWKQIPVIILSSNYFLNRANGHLVAKSSGHFFKDSCKFEQLLQAIKESLASTARSGLLGNESELPAPASRDTQELPCGPQVVCAWTNRIKVDGEWMGVTEFLSERLHLKVTHGISPEAMQQVLRDMR